MESAQLIVAIASVVTMGMVIALVIIVYRGILRAESTRTAQLALLQRLVGIEVTLGTLASIDRQAGAIGTALAKQAAEFAVVTAYMKLVSEDIIAGQSYRKQALEAHQKAEVAVRALAEAIGKVQQHLAEDRTAATEAMTNHVANLATEIAGLRKDLAAAITI